MSDDPAATPPPSFESAVDDLESIVSALERGDLDLAASLASYERGVALLARCQALLDGVDRSVALLAGVEPDGTPILEPFDASATPSPEPVARPARPRAKKAAAPPDLRTMPRPSSSPIDEEIDPPF